MNSLTACERELTPAKAWGFLCPRTLETQLGHCLMFANVRDAISKIEKTFHPGVCKVIEMDSQAFASVRESNYQMSPSRKASFLGISFPKMG